VLERLSPAERSVFILHDVCQFPSRTAASIVGRTPAACVSSPPGPAPFAPRSARAGSSFEHADERMVTERFIAACAGGDVDALVEVLDADVTAIADLGLRLSHSARAIRAGAVARRISASGPATGTTLVSQPVALSARVLAFRGRQLAAMVWFTIVDGIITKMHDRGRPRPHYGASQRIDASDGRSQTAASTTRCCPVM